MSIRRAEDTNLIDTLHSGMSGRDTSLLPQAYSRSSLAIGVAHRPYIRQPFLLSAASL